MHPHLDLKVLKISYLYNLLRWDLGIEGRRVENPALGIFEKEIVIRDAF
jgi:hypothetical protein